WEVDPRNRLCARGWKSILNNLKRLWAQCVSLVGNRCLRIWICGWGKPSTNCAPLLISVEETSIQSGKLRQFLWLPPRAGKVLPKAGYGLLTPISSRWERLLWVEYCLARSIGALKPSEQSG